MSCSGSGASGSWIVSSSEIWSPLESETVAHLHAELLAHLLVVRRALELVLELGVDPLDLPGPRAHRPRDPVERAQLVDDRAPDARDRIGLELDLAREIEAFDRRDQPEQAVGDEIGLVDVGGEPRAHPPRDVLDERRIGDDETLTSPVLPRRLVAAPEVLELDRFDVRFQRCLLVAGSRGALQARG